MGAQGKFEDVSGGSGPSPTLSGMSGARRSPFDESGASDERSPSDEQDAAREDANTDRTIPADSPLPPGARLASGERAPSRATHSTGYYSRTDAQVESIFIPRAPRVPRIADLDDPARDVGTNGGHERTAARETIRTSPAPSRTSPPPANGRTESASRQTPSGAEQRLASPSSRPPRSRESGSAPRVFIPLPLRRQADAWLHSGSLELPASSTPRHARAMQRALLLALLMEPGWDGLPLGLQQRASWLFRVSWTQGDGARDADDLCTLLGLRATPDSRDVLRVAVELAIPEAEMQPSSSLPPQRRSTPPPRSSVSPPSAEAQPPQERPTSRPPKPVGRSSSPPGLSSPVHSSPVHSSPGHPASSTQVSSSSRAKTWGS